MATMMPTQISSTIRPSSHHGGFGVLTAESAHRGRDAQFAH
jgi:hypothetical protein